jgi:hypothetical protein
MIKVGRPSKYKKKYAKDLIKFFDIPETKVLKHTIMKKNGDIIQVEEEIAQDLPTIIGFCRKINSNTSTFKKWIKAHKEFRTAYEQAKELQEEFWKKNSMKGFYNPLFTVFMGKNVFGWKDKQEVDHNPNGEPIKYEIVSYKDTK